MVNKYCQLTDKEGEPLAILGPILSVGRYREKSKATKFLQIETREGTWQVRETYEEVLAKIDAAGAATVDRSGWIEKDPTP